MDIVPFEAAVDVNYELSQRWHEKLLGFRLERASQALHARWAGLLPLCEAVREPLDYSGEQ
jgi:hypothetical protein